MLVALGVRSQREQSGARGAGVFGNFLGLLTPPGIEVLDGREFSSTLRSNAKQLPYQAVLQPVQMLSMVLLLNFLRICGPMPSFFSLLTGKRHCLALFPTVLVCLDHDRSLEMRTLRNLKLSTRSSTAPSCPALLRSALRFL